MSTKLLSRGKVIGAILLVIAVAVVAMLFITRSKLASRPVIQNLKAAPQSAHTLIKEIAKRSDASCYPAIVGKQITPTVKVTKHNFQNFDYVAVVSVADDQKLINLKVVCVSGAGDFIVLTANGWKESGTRQM